MRRTLVRGLFLVAVVWIPSDSLGAADAKTHSGTECVARDGDAQSFLTYFDGIAENEDTASVHTVVCPFTRDNTGSTTGFNDFEVRVRHYGSINFNCTVWSRNSGNGEVDSATDAATVSGDNRLIDFGSAINVSSSKGVY
jgi:hypothetical protein